MQEAFECLITVLGELSDYELEVTGHSLGADVAKLVTMNLLSGERKTFVNPEVTKISCVTLAFLHKRRWMSLVSLTRLVLSIYLFIYCETVSIIV